MPKSIREAERGVTRFITVFIPTYNGEGYIKECIDAVLGQSLPDGYLLELLIIDSGSSDRTVEVIRSFGDRVTLLEIPNAEFSHGGTRDKAAHLAKGEFVLFLSQDAVPASERWLINMTEPFLMSEQVGCVLGSQRPRASSSPTIRREVTAVFEGLGRSGTIVVDRAVSLADGQREGAPNAFFSDVNSAARRQLLIGPVPFRHVPYAEDQALARDMLASGYLKAYAPTAAVWHSHSYTAREYFGRKVDEFVGLRESVGWQLNANWSSLLLSWVRPTLGDWRFLWHDRDSETKARVVWSLKAPAYNFAATAGQFAAARAEHVELLRKKFSLERGRTRHR
jgi:rhamnosyltransferase